MSNTPTLEQCLAALDRSLENFRCMHLTDEERALYLSNKGHFQDLALSRGIRLSQLMAEFRSELAKTTGFIVFPKGVVAAPPASGRLQ